MSELSDAPVLSELIPTATAGVHIGRITLNSPKTLNSLNLEIILSLSEILGSWIVDYESDLVACSSSSEL